MSKASRERQDMAKKAEYNNKRMAVKAAMASNPNQKVTRNKQEKLTNTSVTFSVNLNPTEESFQQLIDNSSISRGIYFGTDMLLNFGGPIVSLQWGEDEQSGKSWRWHLLHANDVTIPVFLNQDVNKDGTINLYRSSFWGDGGAIKFSLEDAVKIVGFCHLSWLFSMRHDQPSKLVEVLKAGAYNIIKGINAVVTMNEENDALIPQLHQHVCNIRNGAVIID
jgi:hypothetical protein